MRVSEAPERAPARHREPQRPPHGVHLRLDRRRSQHAAGLRVTRAGELPHQRGVLHDERAPLAVALRDLGENLLEAAARHGVVGRKVRAAEERGTVGGEERRDGVAAETRQPAHGRLVALRHVGSLVAIDPHGDEQRVDHRPERGVLVHLAIHCGTRATIVGSHVEQHRPVEASGPKISGRSWSLTWRAASANASRPHGCQLTGWRAARVR